MRSTSKAAGMTTTCLAQFAYNGDWESLRAKLAERDVDVDSSTWDGKSTLYWAAFHGELRIMEMLLPLVDINRQDLDESQTALHAAAMTNHKDCVKLLLDYGASKDVTDASGRTALHYAASRNHEEVVALLLEYDARTDVPDMIGDLPLDVAVGSAKAWLEEVTVRRTESTASSSSYLKMQSSGAVLNAPEDDKLPHLSFVRHGQIKETQSWLDTQPDDIDKFDVDGRSALMYAVQTRNVKLVQVLLTYGPNVDATDITGKTALMLAVDMGDHVLASLLLHEFADIDVEDYEGNTALTLVSDVIMNNQDMDVDDWITCKSLLKKENIFRATSPEYRQRFQAKIEAHIRKAPGFHDALFRRAVNLHPEFGAMFLDECLVVERHSLSFHHLNQLYGTNARSSALYHLLHPQNPDMQHRINKSILSHLAMRRVLELKWELFGQRFYVEQLLLYLLLVTSMSLSVLTNGMTDKQGHGDMPELLLTLWVVVVSFVTAGSIVVHFLHPEWLWSFARGLHDWRWTSFDPTLVIPNLDQLKYRARRYLLLLSLVATSLLALALHACLTRVLRMPNACDDTFYVLNSLVLWVTAAYFLRLEMKELLGASGSIRQGLASLYGPRRARQHKQFKTGAKEYFGSATNVWQLVLYLLVLLVYVPCSVASNSKMQPWNQDGRLDSLPRFVLVLGTFIALSLWLLCVQFLEIHPTSGFLLPMLPSLLADVSNFALLYAAVQGGFTTIFYVLERGADQQISKFWAVFTRTYFVMFGQMLDDKEKRVPEKSALSDTAIETYYTVLTMVHAAVVVVLLLNLLMAMMNTTLGRGLERAKAEALASYAQCILRMEMSMGGTAAETTMYLRRPHEGDKWLNPAFDAAKHTAEFATTEEDLETLRALDESAKEWHVGMESLRRGTLDQWHQLRRRMAERCGDDAAVADAMAVALDKRESVVRGHFSKACAATRPTKMTVETRFVDVQTQVLHALEKLAKVDGLPHDLVEITKGKIAREFERQISKTREVMSEPEDVSAGEMWKWTRKQWERQEKQMKEMQQEMQALREQLAKTNRAAGILHSSLSMVESAKGV
ncbi:Aste57867_2624 [Aphanomyces stellatus]|uniref:Aste57867_2624 protein n=1 Tax=Aphanomyces stellatus TaxID=120398 RepID=A0A485KDN0_9STRA|nr:hypothetical protein As57867_002617 [Aphanomyces stellatus]VFT79820.1 Aste57867_2624 [Aphanomyces stellatus]